MRTQDAVGAAHGGALLTGAVATNDMHFTFINKAACPQHPRGCHAVPSASLHCLFTLRKMTNTPEALRAKPDQVIPAPSPQLTSPTAHLKHGLFCVQITTGHRSGSMPADVNTGSSCATKPGSLHLPAPGTPAWRAPGKVALCF